MKKRTLSILLAVAMIACLFAGCGAGESAAPAESAPAPAESAPASVEAAPKAAPEAAPEAPAEAPAPVESAVEEPVEESVPAEAVEEEAPADPCTVTFSTGEIFEATIGEDFVFFFQCDAPGDMGQPNEGEEGAGITVSDGTVTYSNVGLGGPFSYPTSEKVTISGFTGDFTVTVTDAALNMGATYTIYTDEQEIADAIAFAEMMQQQMAANPMPG